MIYDWFVEYIKHESRKVALEQLFQVLYWINVHPTNGAQRWY